MAHQFVRKRVHGRQRPTGQHNASHAGVLELLQTCARAHAPVAEARPLTAVVRQAYSVQIRRAAGHAPENACSSSDEAPRIFSVEHHVPKCCLHRFLELVQAVMRFPRTLLAHVPSICAERVRQCQKHTDLRPATAASDASNSVASSMTN